MVLLHSELQVEVWLGLVGLGLVGLGGLRSLARCNK